MAGGLPYDPPLRPHQSRWRTYAGAYTVDRKVLTVTTSYGKKTAQIGHQVSHDTLAHQLLHELVQEERSRKASRL